MTVLYYIILYIFILYFVHGVIFRNIWFFINTAMRDLNFSYPLDCYTLRTNGNCRFLYINLCVFRSLVNGVNCKARQEHHYFNDSFI
jgi:hypothetical protein